MPLFICPICQSPLQPAADIWHCDGSLNPKPTTHSFDVARQGYVNLLPVQQKKSKDPGDSQHSIIARQRFLQAGYYQPLQTLICAQIQQLLANKKLPQSTAQPLDAFIYQENFKEITENIAKNNLDHKVENIWLDIGCGEGYYTQAIAAITTTTKQLIDTLIAADISKPAVIELAKASKAAKQLWSQKDEQAVNSVDNTVIYPLVTSAAKLPISSGSLAGISSIFSPILPEAFAKVLQDEGYLVIAKPDVGHLSEVRQELFDEVREHNSDKFLAELAPFFRLIDSHYVSTPLSLSAQALGDLLTMTPYAYRARIEKRQALLDKAETHAFMSEAKFVVYILQKI